MNFLSPWFLAGALLIAGPIIFHLIQRRTRDRIQFSTTRFLSESAPRLQKRSQIQNPWLLILRCLIVALLAAAFARPFIENNQTQLLSSDASETRIILIDESASMQRSNLHANAIEKAAEISESLSPNTTLAVYSFAGSIQSIFSPDQWNAALPNDRPDIFKAALANREPTWQPTELGQAIDFAISEFDQFSQETNTRSKRSLTVVSDFSSGSEIAELASIDWPDGLLIDFQPIESETAQNLSLQWLGWTDPLASLNFARVATRSHGYENETSAILNVADANSGSAITETIQIKVSPDQAQISLIPIPADAEGPFYITLLGDEETYDNRIYVAKSEPRKVAISLISEAEESTLEQTSFYVEKAITGWKEPLPSLSIQKPDTSLATADLYLIDAALPESTAQMIRERIDAGSTALLFLDSEQRLPTLEGITRLSPWSLNSRSEDYALIGDIDFQHPQYSPFANPKFNDFTKIRFWNPVSLQHPSSESIRTTASFDDRSPATLEIDIGQGRLVIWQGSWTPQSSQWVLSSKFVPWFQTLAERSLNIPTHNPIIDLREAASIPTEMAKTQDGQALQDGIEAPGLYQISNDNSNRWIAANLSSRESITTPLTIDDWEQLGVPLSNDSQPASPEISEDELKALNSVEIESEQKLWRWVILTAIFFLAVESLVAIKLKSQSQEQPA
ncbi:MAG: BatA domain-containing protein [Verrucomicrobiota bacterium]